MTTDAVTQPAAPGPAAAVEHVSVAYRTAGETVRALDDVSVVIERGETTALSGPSGSGKSTLLRVLGLFEEPTIGAVRLDGEPVGALGRGARRALRRQTIAYVHQRPLANLLSDLRAHEHIGFARQVRGLRRIDPGPILRTFELEHLADSWPAQLSGGEQQRLAFAMATASEAGMILADEPTAELDRVHALEVILTIGRLRGTGVTTVVASHDEQLVAAATRVVTLGNGVVVDE